MKYLHPQRPHKVIVLVLVVALGVAAYVLWPSGSASNNPNEQTNTSDSSTASEDPAEQNEHGKQEQGFDKQQHSIDDPASPWVIVNKQRPLPASYAPEDLRAPNIPLRRGSGSEEMWMRDDAASALERMATAAQADGINLMLASGYRSYGTQQALYTRYVSQDGQAAADRYSARAGHSEHQTGLVADIAPANGTCVVDQCFANTPEGQWVAAHAHTYGFIIRYPEGKESIVGYMYEPWHLRYVGEALASELVTSGQTVEEFFGLPAAPGY